MYVSMEAGFLKYINSRLFLRAELEAWAIEGDYVYSLEHRDCL